MRTGHGGIGITNRRYLHYSHVEVMFIYLERYYKKVTICMVDKQHTEPTYPDKLWNLGTGILNRRIRYIAQLF